MILTAVAILGLSAQVALAQSRPEPMSLDAYRVKSAEPANCIKFGGKLIYNGGTPACQLPQLTAKTPLKATTPARALPITIRH
jgi:hypothetical protein